MPGTPLLRPAVAADISAIAADMSLDTSRVA